MVILREILVLIAIVIVLDTTTEIKIIGIIIAMK